jgi:hypothetical protein
MDFRSLGAVIVGQLIFWGAVVFGAGFLLRGCV